METNKKKGKGKKVLLALVLAVIVTGGIFAYRFYSRYFAPNVTENEPYLYIATGSTIDSVVNNLAVHKIVKDTATFRWAANKMDYPGRVKAGKYKLTKGMNNRQLINLLGGGFQEPVQLRFQNIRLKSDFAAFVASQLEPDSASFMHLFNNSQLAQQYGFSTDSFYCMFIPNTYEFFWNTSAEDFFNRMHVEYGKFWTDERREKAKALNLDPVQVSILASIVRGEALHNDEMPTIAGLYLNRLRKGMLLQADPTVIYAVHDFTIRRVLNKHLSTDSPYNTYLYKGLPPGPINMPSIAAIDGVLNYKKHDYIYMCAKDDFSGYHNFAQTVSEHLVNARKFQQALNERNIKK